MKKEQAFELLQYHSCSHQDINNWKWEKGFLGMLRPFDGNLYEDNFHEIMKILEVLSNDFKAKQINKELISNIWSICQLSRTWVSEESMLQRNNVITQLQIDKLTEWVNCISETVMWLLEGADNDTTFETYHQYVKDNKKV